MEMELIYTNLRRYTFESPKIRAWVEANCRGKVLNLFAGKTLLNLDEVRNDIDPEAPAGYHLDAYEFIHKCKPKRFDTVLLDPPYAYRKAMEMYKGHYTSKFKLIADEVPRVLKPGGIVISFGYHSTFLGKVRKAELLKMCVFAHGGAQHCTIAIIEKP
jgi:hypothetical protein